MKYETVIGLEAHCQLKTETKIFCGCPTRFGENPNRNTCPICLGMPGVLPVLNKKALEFAMKASLATHCTIQPLNRFARKNYFYPDLPKGYQISQFELPLSKGGYIDIHLHGTSKRIGITRIHMEEDAGKLIHGENLGHPDLSYVDFNRTGIPLIEIVSEPDLRSPEEAKDYLIQLKTILEYAEVSDCNMEEGSLRCDANISLRPVGQKKYGTRTELKNINSFRFVQKALKYEIERQAKILDQGDSVIQETRLWDESRGLTFSMRTKEEAHDYRYFPEPDLVPVVIDGAWIETIRKSLPELPAERQKRFIKNFKIPKYDAGVLTASKALAAYFEECALQYDKPKAASNWIMVDLLRKLKKSKQEIDSCPISPKALVGMLKMIDTGTINGKMAKTVFEEMFQTGKSAEIVIQEKGLIQIRDNVAILKMIDAVFKANPEQAEEFKNGKEKLMVFFVGQVMKASKGQANPSLVNKLLKEKLE